MKENIVIALGLIIIAIEVGLTACWYGWRITLAVAGSTAMVALIGTLIIVIFEKITKEKNHDKT